MKTVNLSLSIAVATMIFAAATTSAFIKAEGQQGMQSFSGSLLGSNEKPPTKSNSTGTANFQANENNSMISYTFNVTGIKKITQTNIRNGSQGENGDIVVVLSKSKSAK
ncbi:MAG TPA: CHRD domain-containing protein, partial [Nitrososphaeraceae archaeon]|nr:CHRD domain-containing protein [Nitrososphaeraceae archaeon]